MIDPDTDKLLGVSAGTTAGLYVLNLLWRMFGKTRVDNARDRAEIDLLDTLRQENKLLRERVKLAEEESAALRAQVLQLKGDIAMLDLRVNELLRKLNGHGERR